MVGPASIFLSVAVVIAAVAAWCDWRTGHIPNWVTLPPLGLAPIAYFAYGLWTKGAPDGAVAAGLSILGALCCSIVPALLYRMSAIGGGDVKLLAAIGALVGIQAGIEAEFFSFIVAAIVVPGRLAWEGRLMPVLGNTVALVVNPFLPEKRRRALSVEMLTTIRFGPAIFAGTAMATLLQWRLQ